MKRKCSQCGEENKSSEPTPAGQNFSRIDFECSCGAMGEIYTHGKAGIISLNGEYFNG